jgi:hypothetical protein
MNTSLNESNGLFVGNNVQEQILGQRMKEFIGWQCRIRQHVVRKQEGRPSAGMRPQLLINGALVAPITINIIKADPVDVTSEFCFIHKKTADHKTRYENGLKVLCEYYYQRTEEFDHEFNAVFSLDSDLAERIVESKEVELRFEQGNQNFRLQCQTRQIPLKDEKYEATYWHNALFNPNMPGVVTVVGFNAFEVVSE